MPASSWFTVDPYHYTVLAAQPLPAGRAVKLFRWLPAPLAVPIIPIWFILAGLLLGPVTILIGGYLIWSGDPARRRAGAFLLLGSLLCGIAVICYYDAISPVGSGR